MARAKPAPLPPLEPFVPRLPEVASPRVRALLEAIAQAPGGAPGAAEALLRSRLAGLDAALADLLSANQGVRPSTPAWAARARKDPAVSAGRLQRRLQQEQAEFQTQLALLYRVAVALVRRGDPAGGARVMEVFRAAREPWVRRRLAEAVTGAGASPALLAALGAEVGRQPPSEISRGLCATARMRADPASAFDALAPLVRAAEPGDNVVGGVCAALDARGDPRWVALARELVPDQGRRSAAFALLCRAWGAPGAYEAAEALLRHSLEDGEPIPGATDSMKELRHPSPAPLMALLLGRTNQDAMTAYDLAEVGDPAVLPALRARREVVPARGKKDEGLRRALDYAIETLSAAERS